MSYFIVVLFFTVLFHSLFVSSCLVYPRVHLPTVSDSFDCLLYICSNHFPMTHRSSTTARLQSLCDAANHSLANERARADAADARVGQLDAECKAAHAQVEDHQVGACVAMFVCVFAKLPDHMMQISMSYYYTPFCSSDGLRACRTLECIGQELI